jgi:LuxR family maltose regulon positive regulatory protein
MAGDIEGQIAVLWAWLAVYRNEPDSIYAHASRALELLNPDDRPARTAAHCARGVAQMFRGELAEAQVAFSKVIGAGRSSGNLMFAAVAATALAGIQTTRYQLHLAAASYREVIGMISDPSHVLGFEAHLGLATILVDWNELDEAESLALLCSELVSRAKSQTELGADLLRARLMLASNEHVEAEALLSRTDATLKAGPLTDRMREAADLRVQHFLRRGELNKAADLAETYQVPLGLARTKLARGEARDALRILQEHRRSMEAQARTQDALKAAVVEVMVLRAMGSVALALQTLRECLTLAQDQGSVRLFVEEGAPMKKLLAPLQQEAAFGRFVSRLLGAFETRAGREEGAAATLEPDSANMPYGAFSLRELEILRLIQEGLSNQNICDRLFLSLSTVKWHNQNIFAKLDVQRRTEAVARALQLKLL